MDFSPAFAMLTLFPSADHQELAVSFYGFDQPAAPVLADGPAAVGNAIASPEGLEVLYRRTFDTEDVRLGDQETATGETLRFRYYRDANGEVQIDELSAELLLLSFHRRMVLGDKVDVGLLFGQWDEVWRFGDTGRVQWRFFSPLKFTALGFAKNDMDDDDRVKYYIGGGAGLGGDAVIQLAGPLGVQLRADAFMQSKNRFRRGDRNTVRHELELNAELGLSGLRDTQAWVLSAWGNAVTQWDPRDAEGRDGIDRQYIAGGVRLSGRFYKPREEPSLEPDIENLLEALRNAERQDGDGGGDTSIGGIFERPPGEKAAPNDKETAPEEGPEGSEGGVVGDTRDASVPLEVHWSEVMPTAEVAPSYPADLDPSATCQVRFFIDPTGEPYDIRPEACPTEMRAATMEAAWSWRFEPVVENDDTVSAQFIYTFTPNQLRSLVPAEGEAGEADEASEGAQ